MPRILIVKTSSMGDVVHCLPLVTDLARELPDAQIDWVVEDLFSDIPALHAAVGRVIPVAVRRWRRVPFDPATWREIRGLRSALRAVPYDVVLDAQGLLKSALVSVQARGPVWGLDRRSAREPLAALFYRRGIPVPTGRHAVLRLRELGARAFDYVPPATPPDYGLKAAPARAPLEVLPPRYAVCLHATSRDSKLWPEQHWIALATQLAAAGLGCVLPWGSAAERARAERLAARMPEAVVLPQLAIRTLAQVIRHAEAVIGVDTGLVHLAAALDRPTVAVFTDTDPVLTGVLGRDPARAVNLGAKGRIPTAAEVFDALTRMHALTPAAAPC